MSLFACFSGILIEPYQSLKPSDKDIDVTKSICVLPDDAHRKEAYNRVMEGLREKGFTDIKEKTNLKTEGCDYLFSCQSASAWDLSNFTSQIHLKLYEDGELISEAHYTHANNGNFNKFINTKEMVNKMLNGMMPNTKPLKTRYNKKHEVDNSMDE